MAYLTGLVFWLCCFASDVVELVPIAASGTGISSSANIVCTAITDTSCDTYPGCAWDLNVPQCVKDPCFKWNSNTNIDDFLNTEGFNLACKGSRAPATPVTGITEPHFNYLSTNPSSGGCSSGSWISGYPAQYNQGGGADFYSQKNSKSPLDQCQYKYLVNGTCNDVPWCILQDAAVAGAGKVCTLLPACETINTANVIRLPSDKVCACLDARLQAGDTTACDQNPGCYKNTTGNCAVDPCYQAASNQESPDCSGVGTGCVVATVLEKQGTSGQASFSICVTSNGNSSPNKCWRLANSTVNSAEAQCPVNPNLDSKGYNESEAWCTGDCQVVEVSTYYYGPKKICVDAEHLPEGRSMIVRISSIVAFLLIVAMLSL